MTIEWLAEEAEVEVTRAGRIAGGLSWLAEAADTTEATGSEFVASTPTVDRMGDSIDQQTWRLAAFRRNPVFLADHSRRDVVGRVKRVGRTAAEDGTAQLRISVDWDEDESNPRGILLAHQHRAGFRRAVSVGFIPGEATNRTELAADHPLYLDPKTTSRWMAGSLYRHNELIEVSSVSVPANAEALQLSAETHADDTASLERALDALLPSRLRSQVLGLLRRDAEVRAVITAAVRVAPTERQLGPTDQGIPWLRSQQ